MRNVSPFAPSDWESRESDWNTLREASPWQKTSNYQWYTPKTATLHRDLMGIDGGGATNGSPLPGRKEGRLGWRRAIGRARMAIGRHRRKPPHGRFS
jgi:hypothetical protein